MRVGLTGWTGFVGRRTCSALDAAGVEVVTLGRGASVRPWSPPEAPDVDLRGLDVVVHLASFIPPGHGPEHAERCVQVNALGTLALLEAARRDGVSHVVHMSSGNVYADPTTTPTEAAAAFPDRLAPYYLGSKLLADVWVSHAGRAGPGTTILRPSAIYGPGMRSGVVRVFVDRLRGGEEVRAADGGRFRSDLVFVDDVVRSVVAAVRHRPGGIVNVGSGRSTSVRELAETLVGLLGLPADRVRIEPPGEGATPGFAPLDIQRLTDLVGDGPTPIALGLRRMLDEESAA